MLLSMTTKLLFYVYSEDIEKRGEAEKKLKMWNPFT